MLGAPEYLQDFAEELAGYQSRKRGKNGYAYLIAHMMRVMSEDNLHEVLEAAAEDMGYKEGDFWYGDRADFIDREFWE